MSYTFLSLVLSLAAPSECARDDLACTARAAEREAKAATTPEERAEARLTAARAHLALYQGTGAKKHLCQARRLVAGLRPAPELGALLPATREQIERELTQRKLTCLKSPSPPPPADSPTPSEPVPSPPAIDEEQHEVPSVRFNLERVDTPTSGPNDDLLRVDASRRAPIVRESTPTPGPAVTEFEGKTRPDAAPSAGRRLLIAGGVLVGGAAMAGGLAALAAARADSLATEQNAVAAKTHDQGFTDPASRTASEELAARVAHWERVTLGAALACAVVSSSAVALLTAGAVRRRRAPRVVVGPGFAGLLWSARF